VPIGITHVATGIRVPRPRNIGVEEWIDILRYTRRQFPDCADAWGRGGWPKPHSYIHKIAEERCVLPNVVWKAYYLLCKLGALEKVRPGRYINSGKVPLDFTVGTMTRAVKVRTVVIESRIDWEKRAAT